MIVGFFSMNFQKSLLTNSFCMSLSNIHPLSVLVAGGWRRLTSAVNSAPVYPVETSLVDSAPLKWHVGVNSEPGDKPYKEL